MQSHGAGNLANHVTIDKIVFGRGSAKCRETNTQKAVGCKHIGPVCAP